jgi:HSP20 family protein
MVKESSFLKKLKKGMGVEKEEVVKKEKQEEEIEKKEPPQKTKKIEMKASAVEEKKKSGKVSPKPSELKQKWLEPEGELAVDVYQTEEELVIQSAIAGIKPEDLDISIEEDVIIIRGKREKPFEEKEDYFTQECYWGPFSRNIILPVEVDPGRIKASMKEGILTIRIPKILREKKRKIAVKKLT